MASNNKKCSLSMQQRLDILRDLETHSIAMVAAKYRVHAMTIRRIRKNVATIAAFAAKDSVQRNRRRLRKPLYEELEKSLFTWYVERKTLGDALSDNILLEKAYELKQSMPSCSNFKVSKGWLVKFKRRNNIRLVHPYIDKNINKYTIEKSSSIQERTREEVRNERIKVERDQEERVQMEGFQRLHEGFQRFQEDGFQRFQEEEFQRFHEGFQRLQEERFQRFQEEGFQRISEEGFQKFQGEGFQRFQEGEFQKFQEEGFQRFQQDSFQESIQENIQEEDVQSENIQEKDAQRVKREEKVDCKERECNVEGSVNDSEETINQKIREENSRNELKYLFERLEYYSTRTPEYIQLMVKGLELFFLKELNK